MFHSVILICGILDQTGVLFSSCHLAAKQKFRGCTPTICFDHMNSLDECKLSVLAISERFVGVALECKLPELARRLIESTTGQRRNLRAS